MVKKKRQSKRVTLKDKYKIERKVREHDRKQRKKARQAAKNGGGTRKLNKDPGIPNLWPYKEKLLQQMEAQRLREEERRERAREMGREERKKLIAQKRGGGLSLEDIASAAQRSEKFDEEQEAAQEAKEEMEAQGISLDSGKRKKRTYLKELRNVVSSADVILQVLDARDPLSCRAELLENMVLQEYSGKRLVLVLNKIDLVPKQVVQQWLERLRREFPTVAFKASTQEQRQNLGRAKRDNLSLTKGASNLQGDGSCVGADSLLQLLKNYSRNKNLKTAITVGVVGYPNVGKSSLINSLKRARVVGVSPTPGFTKSLQVVQLDKKVKLIDSPGVLFRDSTHGQSTSLILQNCLDPAILEDPVAPVHALVTRCHPEQLMQVYSIKRFKTPQEFLVLVAHKRGKYGKGGIPNTEAAARQVLNDWNAGVVPFYTPPPVEYAPQNEYAAQVVTTMSKEFDLEALMAKHDSELVENVPERDEDDFIQMDGAVQFQQMQASRDDESDDESME